MNLVAVIFEFTSSVTSALLTQTNVAEMTSRGGNNKLSKITF